MFIQSHDDVPSQRFFAMLLCYWTRRIPFFFPSSLLRKRVHVTAAEVVVRFCADGAALSETGASDAQQSSKLTASPGAEQ